MSDSNGQACPECAAPRQPDGTPSCGCTRRASEALRDVRTAQAAAAEDFDSLRIRPYVELDFPAAETPAAPDRPAPEPAEGPAAPAGTTAPDETMRLTALPEAAARPPAGAAGSARPATDPAAGVPSAANPDQRAQPRAEAGDTVRPGADPAGRGEPPAAPDQTMKLAAVTRGAGAPGEGGAEQEAAAERTMRLAAVPAGAVGPTGPAGRHQHPAPAHPDDMPPRHRRRTVLLAAGGTVAAALAAAWFVGLFSAVSPERDGALPENVRASVPEASPDGTSAPASSLEPVTSAPESPASPTSTDPSPSAPSASASPDGSPGPSVSAADPARSAPAPAQPADPSPPPSDDYETSSTVTVLRLGDKGPEVSELQQRLHRLKLYFGPANGSYTHRVESAVRGYQFMRGITEDEYGVYGPTTRARLESETS
ncbi:peptidoglycan-binding domain-containing protein [Streptomyces nodosus]|uniref:peptidoglycan-binding domain-containing protein n=1 Tax=Streptomyces nodosus TaxID=40318 RepID=UPI003801C9BF